MGKISASFYLNDESEEFHFETDEKDEKDLDTKIKFLINLKYS